MARAKKRKVSSPSNSYKSLIYGIATVIILFIIGFGMAKFFINRNHGEVDSGAVSTSRVKEAIQAAKQANVSPSPTPQTMAPKITGEKYTIKPGDNLWDISVRRYGNGYRWVEIARLNNLENPDLIYPDNTLVLPK